MAVKKATTTSDLTTELEPGVDASPTREDAVERIVEHTDPKMVAEVKDVKYVKVKSPTGFTSEVPESLVAALVQSGYSKS